MNTVLFIMMLVISMGVDIIFLREIKSDLKSEKASKRACLLQKISRILAAILAVAAISDALYFLPTGVYQGAFALLGIVSEALFACCEINKKKKIPMILFGAKVLTIAAFLEITLFNLPVYRLWAGDFGEMEFKAERFSSAGEINYRPKENDIEINEYNGVEFTLEGINEEVGNVFVDLAFENGTKGAMMYIDAMDETQTTVYRSDIANAKMVRGRKGSQYADLQLSGKISNMRIRIVPMNGGIVYVNSISLNTPAPMEILWLRVLLIVLISCFIRAAVSGRTLQFPYLRQKKLCRIGAVCITAVTCIVVFMVTDYKVKSANYEWKDYLRSDSGNQMSQELVEAFEHGSTALLEEPAKEVKEFDDPYDRQLRESEGLDIRWDHVYYEGKYYSYYGIAPVVLVFMPYHLITGSFLPDGAAIMLFAIIGVIGLSFLYMKYIEKYFPKTPCSLVMAGLVMIQTVSGIWFSVGRPQFYEAAIAAGFAFLTWAFYFFVSAGIIGSEKPSLPRTMIASLLFAVAVLSRPTLVLYCICAAVFMLAAVPRAAGRTSLHEKNQKLFNKSSLRYICCAILPMACIGLVQMWYNFDRFGSPFEFGIQYSLTINDFTRTQFHWQLSLVALYNYLFNTPIFTPVYPIVSTKFQFMNVGGFFYEDYYSTMNSSGLFFLALPMFAYFISGKALKRLPDRRTRLSRMAYIGIPCVLIPFIIISSVWESGYAVRYMADFSWQSLLGAFAIIFWLYSKTESQHTKKRIRQFMCFSLVWTLFVGGVQNINQMLRFTDNCWEFPEISYDVEQFFAFWK